MGLVKQIQARCEQALTYFLTSIHPFRQGKSYKVRSSWLITWSATSCIPVCAPEVANWRLIHSSNSEDTLLLEFTTCELVPFKILMASSLREVWIIPATRHDSCNRYNYDFRLKRIFKSSSCLVKLFVSINCKFLNFMTHLFQSY